MNARILVIGDDRRETVGGTLVRSAVLPGTDYWFSEAGRSRLEAFGTKELVSIDRGGGAYVLDPEKKEFCCLAQHHYAVCRVSDASALVLLNREVLETDLRRVWRWSIGLGDWLEFEDNHLEFNEAALQALREFLGAKTPSEEYSLEYERAGNFL